jgi:metal-responsive CopG/Arc/MetJ family transcriptional regulator
MKTRKPRPKETGTLVGVRLQDHLLITLDNYRREQPDLPNRPEAIRRILEAFLKKTS